MAEYISREAAIDAIKAMEWHDFAEDHFPDAEYAYNDGLIAAMNAVAAIPAADVVEVVRCRKCEHNYGTQKAPRCDFTEFRLTPNSYCSCGFRKMDESEDENNV